MLGIATHNLAILKLTPINMLVSLVVLNLGYRPRARLYAAQTLVLLFGYFIEVAGVHTDWIFGSYRYLDNLGPKILDTPLIMGVNWVITVFCSASVVALFKLNHDMLRAALGAVLMVMMDLFIESICEKSGFWAWAHGEVPLRNFVAWLVIGFGIQYAVLKFKTSLNNYLGVLLYILQIVFFIFAYKYL